MQNFSRFAISCTRIYYVLNINSRNLSKSIVFVRYKSTDKAMKVLNVAEKNDAAKNIAGHLSRGTFKKREGFSVYNKIFEFNAQVFNQNCTMIMTSVSGHLLNHEFVGAYRKWQGCHPLSLFDAPIAKQCSDDSAVKIKRTLEREVQKCNTLVIWTDCDREGENIGFEIIEVCKAVNPNMRVYRAKFSEITQAAVNRALQTLCEPNEAVSNAVDVRSQLDLRIGAAFTRFQTMRLQKVFPRNLADMLISYGSCQFPTLGFVVERFLAIDRFKPEPYWKIKVIDTRDDISVEFRWERVRLFEKLPCEVFLETCLAQPDAVVKKVTSKPKTKWRPLPLDTIELEKQASRKLHLSAKETMKIAEKLYTQGLISYPRTETNIFPKEFDLASLVRQQANHQAWGGFAQRLLTGGVNPRQGKKSDQAHPPIHPIKYSDSLQGNEARVYEFVVRHFLACLSDNAVGQETIVEIDIAGEFFIANGLRIVAKNYLEVYIYEKWSDKEIFAYQEGHVFRPTSIDMVEENTSPPQLLTEADLITLMDKYGIGTDATHAEHIDTIKSRQYVGLTDGKHLMPGKLGIGLVMGYNNMGFQMSKPNLRADLEKDLKSICDGQKDPNTVLQTQIRKYREVFKIALERANLIDNALADYLDEQPNETEQLSFNTRQGESVVLKCPKCEFDMELRNKKQGSGKYIGCMGYPTCNNAIWFPQTVENVEILNETCTECTGSMHKLKFQLTRNAFPIYGTCYTTCIGGCDPSFNEMLNIRKKSIEKVERMNDTGYSTMSDSSRSIAVSSEPQVRNERHPGTGSRANSSQNTNTSIGFARNQNSNRNKPSTSQNTNTNVRRQNTSRGNNTRIDTSASNFSRGESKPKRQEQTWGNIDNDAIIMCNCHQNAIQLTVKKSGPNQGKLFYKCAKPQGTGCDFFVWASEDTPPVPSNTGRNVRHTPFPTTVDWGRTNNTISHGTGDSAPGPSGTIMCHCNLLAKQRTVQKEGPNKGRPFYVCPKGMNDSCKFFQWADENTGDSNETFNQNTSNRARGKGSEHKKGSGAPTKTRANVKRKCGICGMEGHTRRTCPENGMD